MSEQIYKDAWESVMNQLKNGDQKKLTPKEIQDVMRDTLLAQYQEKETE